MAEPVLQNIFLIEIRPGRTKWRLKRNTAEIADLFSIQEYREKHPHITLFGPFSLRTGTSVPHLLKAVEHVGQQFSAIPFLIDGYELNQGLHGAVIAYRVVPTEALIDLNEGISQIVSNLAEPETINHWDRDPDRRWFHITIANRLDRSLGLRIFQQLNGGMQVVSNESEQPTHLLDRIRRAIGANTEVIPRSPPPPLLDEDGLRITVINGDQIIAEYDLIQHRFFSPHAGHAAEEWQKTLQQFRRQHGRELLAPQYSKKPDTYVISDLHLGHANIIKYCCRPFSHDDITQMDEMLIRNWNYTVRPGDNIYHLGDLCYGPHAKDPLEYTTRLNGNITFINGNHDSQSAPTHRTESLLFEGIPFIFVHDPADAPEISGTWVIHGHYHNNDLQNYPFINFEKRRINVSCEVTGYRPVSLTTLCHTIKEHQVKPKIKRLLLRDGDNSF